MTAGSSPAPSRAWPAVTTRPSPTRPSPKVPPPTRPLAEGAHPVAEARGAPRCPLTWLPRRSLPRRVGRDLRDATTSGAAAPGHLAWAVPDGPRRGQVLRGGSGTPRAAVRDTASGRRVGPPVVERVFYCAGVAQLSFFSAEARDAQLDDLAGLLCGPAQVVRFGASDTARLSMVLPDPGRAAALTAAAAARGVATELADTGSGSQVLRTAFRRDLVPLARRWCRGAVKAVPDDFALDGALLRMWVLAAGIPDRRSGFLLGLDPYAPDTHAPLGDAVTRLGLPVLRLGPRGAGPALRVSGVRRLRRLAELVGPPPAYARAAHWPGGQD